jgi:hypothetical protein
MKKQKAEKRSQEGRLEFVIAVLAGFLFIFGVAGWMATDGVQLGFKLLQSPNSLASMTTEDGLFTDEGLISFNRIRGIINNLELFSICAMTFGGIVCAAFTIRIKRRLRVVRVS